MVEEGYIQNKYRRNYDWLFTFKSPEPDSSSLSFVNLGKQGLTAPQSLKILFKEQANRKKDATKAPKATTVQEIIEIEVYIRQSMKMKSRRCLQNMLTVEEMQHKGETFHLEYFLDFSNKIITIIQLKMFFYANFMMIIYERLRQISYIKWGKSQEKSAKILNNNIVKDLTLLKTQAEQF